MEKWKDITGYEGRYKISSYGRVLSCTTGQIKQEYIEENHCYVDLYTGGKRKHLAVHRLVAMHFIPFVYDDDDNYDVHHKDEVPWHNNVENLCILNKYKHYLLHQQEGSKNMNKARKVICLDTGEIFNSAGAAGRYCIKKGLTEAKTRTVINCIKEACKREGTSYGLKWRFV